MPRAAALILTLAFGAALAQDLPAEIETIPAGPDNGHLPLGFAYEYGTPFPTSGPHSPRPTPAWMYTEPQPPTELVHALEDRNIVIYYDQPGDAVIKRLLELTQQYSGQSDGVIATPSLGLGEGIVLTAWEKRLALPSYDEQKTAAFIDAFRGYEPGGVVR
jgi:hypothetical protein